MPAPIAPSTPPSPLPAGLSPAAFIARYWHKQPLLARNAMPGFAGLLRRAQLFALASRDDVEARLVLRDGRHWQLEHGPFSRRRLALLPPSDWTLLVQGVNLHDDAADALLRRFAFLPYARLDDLMISYAAPGGGVGPHVDSYDVFLLQGEGHRRWRYGRQRDLSLTANLPLKILRRFEPTADAVLAPGDMLYLPPHIAHDGVAVDACTTYSIGFRASGATELAHALLDFLRDDVDLKGRYADPDLAAVTAPARLDAATVARFAGLLDGLKVTPALFRRFLGQWLSEPHAQVTFEPPAQPSTAAAFARTIARTGLALDRRTQMFYDAQMVYCNGQGVVLRGLDRKALRALANRRALDAAHCAASDRPTLVLFHQWYCDGYVHTAR